MESPDMGSY